MVKTKGGRSMNPTDAFRKEERRKQVNRNKLERKLQREAHRKINNASSLRDELKSIIAAGEEGTLNKTMRLKKKVLQDAYDQALRKQKETEMRTQMMDEDAEESRDGNEIELPTPTGTLSLQQVLPVPPPPPLPPGERPTHTENGMGHVVPPPPGPPQGYLLPPPPGPPPGMYPMGRSPQPMYPYMSQGRSLVGGMDGRPSVRRRTTEEVVRDHKPTITAAPTVVKKPLAQNDRSITSMVPASVMIKREKPRAKSKSGVRKPDIAPGVSTDPVPKRNTNKPEVDRRDKPPTLDQRMATFLSEVSSLGAFEK